MIERLMSDFGPWNWWVFGFALLALEILVPGVYLVWFGLAALLVGILSLMLWDAAFWIWQVQIVAFLALSLAIAVAGQRIVSRYRTETDEPLLNRRTDQLVGRTATLEEAIREGRGRVRIGDTLWRVTGPDLPAGTRVRVSASEGGELRVEPV